MSVNPGFGGQKFIPQALRKIKKAKALFAYVNRKDAVVEVDGGVNAATIEGVREAGVDIVVAGSAVFGAEDRAAMIQTLRG